MLNAKYSPRAALPVDNGQPVVTTVLGEAITRQNRRHKCRHQENGWSWKLARQGPARSYCHATVLGGRWGGVITAVLAGYNVGQ